jgi:hypothetical protein
VGLGIRDHCFGVNQHKKFALDWNGRHTSLLFQSKLKGKFPATIKIVRITFVLAVSVALRAYKGGDLAR